MDLYQIVEGSNQIMDDQFITMPTVLPVKPDGVPEVMKLRRQWVCWQLQFENGKWKKVPVDPKTGRFASPTDPSSWGTFAEAWKYYQWHKKQGIGGVGFVFTETDPFAGVDLDKCRDPETGVIQPWALEIVERLNSYTEISPSGKGLHIIVFGVLPPGQRKVGDVEMYDGRHYFTITGQRLGNSTGKLVESRPKELHLVHARFLGADYGDAARRHATTPGRHSNACVGNEKWEMLLQKMEGAKLTPADRKIIRALQSGQYGEVYRLLFTGYWEGAGLVRKQGRYKSQSEAEQAMFNRLARLTKGDPVRMYAIFRESPSFERAKIKNHRTYLVRTIFTAIDGLSWSPPQSSTCSRG